jgi:hypothetical protein
LQVTVEATAKQAANETQELRAEVRNGFDDVVKWFDAVMAELGKLRDKT